MRRDLPVPGRKIHHLIPGTMGVPDPSHPIKCALTDSSTGFFLVCGDEQMTKMFKAFTVRHQDLCRTFPRVW